MNSSVNQVVLPSSALRVAGTGSSTFVNGRSKQFAIITTYITGKSGSPTLSLTLQCSPVDPNVDATKWRNIYTEPTITNAQMGTPSATSPKIFGGAVNANWSGYLRVLYVIAGATTPKLTFSVNIELK